ncbi:uncharacterized protein LOC133835745 [Drosophila sulfurigaster albostrigata]|uniref:uncharacterized protein LOC133835745 n=1 Tax=Drosophila sulfurigaster albostrigata TaxID=89887 RepID=UPI002D21A630|nr:uncharacterized protein LOC133835745 [Drosophila sulfurigaster albostrigata]
MSLAKFKTPLAFLGLCLCLSYKVHSTVAAPAARYEDNLIAYPTSPSEVLPIEPLLIYPETREVYYQARTLDGDEERDIIFVKLLKDKSNSYRPKLQRLVEKKEQRRKELSMKDIFFVKARTNGQFSHERLKVYRLPEFYAISVFRNDEK